MDTLWRLHLQVCSYKMLLMPSPLFPEIEVTSRVSTGHVSSQCFWIPCEPDRPQYPQTLLVLVFYASPELRGRDVVLQWLSTISAAHFRLTLILLALDLHQRDAPHPTFSLATLIPMLLRCCQVCVRDLSI
jgi:hypothetical protein